MKIFITGGTGLIGSALIKELLKKGDSITVLVRDIYKARKKLGTEIKYCESLSNLKSLDGFDVVINLAGKPIADKRWTDKQKERLCRSRWSITQRLSELIRASQKAPSVFISGSAIGYYGPQNNEVLDENSLPYYFNDFTYLLCKKWEALAVEAESPQTRVCLLRTGIVLAKEGGMLPKLLLPFRLGLGSVLGNGNQYMSWIHLQDMVKGIVYLIEHADAQGAFNFTSPYPVTNKQFSKTLAKTLSRPCIFSIPQCVIKTTLGEVSTLLLDGKRAMPQHLQDLGYRFSFEQIDDALSDILK